MTLAVLSLATLLSLLLLPPALWLSFAGRNRPCGYTLTGGLLAAAVAIIGGFGDVDASVTLGLDLPAIVHAKLAIGLGLLHFAVAWVTLLAHRRPAAASLGFIRTRAVARPRTIPTGYHPAAIAPQGPITGPRARPKTRTAAHIRPATPSDAEHDPEAASAR